MLLILFIVKTEIPINIKPTCPIELYTKKRLKIFSENAPKIDTKILKKAIPKNKGCHINLRLSKMFTNNQIIKNTIVNFEKIDKNVNTAKGEFP